MCERLSGIVVVLIRLLKKELQKLVIIFQFDAAASQIRAGVYYASG